jgi:hypothetical protein
MSPAAACAKSVAFDQLQNSYHSQNKKGSDFSEPFCFMKIILAATYVPTQLPVQYHRLSGA